MNRAARRSASASCCSSRSSSRASSCRARSTSRSAAAASSAACSPTWASCARRSCTSCSPRHLQIPFVDVRQLTLDQQTVRLLPEAQARRFRALVLQSDARGLLGRHGGSDRPDGVRRAVGATEAAAAHRARQGSGPAQDHGHGLSAHRRDRLDRAGSARGAAPGRHRPRAAQRRRADRPTRPSSA